jgi:hypothetical protein
VGDIFVADVESSADMAGSYAGSLLYPRNAGKAVVTGVSGTQYTVVVMGGLLTSGVLSGIPIGVSETLVFDVATNSVVSDSYDAMLSNAWVNACSPVPMAPAIFTEGAFLMPGGSITLLEGFDNTAANCGCGAPACDSGRASPHWVQIRNPG